MTFILKDQVAEGKYQGKTLLEDGLVLKLAGGKPEDPAFLAKIFPEIQPEDILTEYTQTYQKTANGETMIVTSGAITERWYYIDWTEQDEYTEYLLSRADLNMRLDFMSESLGGEMFIAAKDDPSAEIIYKSSGFADHHSILELGITKENLKSSSFELNLGSVPSVCYPINSSRSGTTTIVYCDNIIDESQTMTHRLLTIGAFVICLLTFLILFCVYTRKSLRDRSLPENELIENTPERVKHKAVLFSIIAGLFLFLIAGFTSFIQESHHENRKGSVILNSLEVQRSALEKLSKDAETIEVEWYEYFAQKLSPYLTQNEILLEKEKLAEISRIISANLIMVFDNNGNEIACSADYVGYSLFDEENEEAARPFRSLLRGVPSIIRTPGTDFIPGKDQYVIGVPYTMPDGTRFGAVILFVDPFLLGQAKNSAAIDQIYENLVTGEEFIVELDLANEKILSSSDKQFADLKFSDLKFTRGESHINDINLFSLNCKIYYVISKVLNDKTYYYAADINTTMIFSLIYSAVMCVIFTAGALLLTGYALRGYKAEYELFFSEANEGSAKDSQQITSYAKTWKRITGEYRKIWDAKSPLMKAYTVFQVMCGILMILLLRAGFVSNSATLAFLATGNWQRGINFFAAAAIFTVFSIGNLLLIALNMFFRFLFLEIDTKSSAIFQIIRSLLIFFIYGAMIYLSLSCFGVNTQALVASVGVVSLALSIGAKDLIADILSGLGIVFEGSYKSGDIVEINGFKGIVENVSVRSTKIWSYSSNNYKFINNHEIHNVTNFSKMPTILKLFIDVPIPLPIDKVEEYLDRELPAIAKEIPQITEGPFYGGISHLGHFYMTVVIIALCDEREATMVQSELNVRLKKRIDILAAPYLEKIPDFFSQKE